VKKILIIVAIVIVVCGGLVAVLAFGSKNSPTNNAVSQQDSTEPIVSDPQESTPTTNSEITSLSVGRYETYTASRVAEEGFTQTVLFFHAPWCPECRAFDQAIANADLADGLQVLKVDYDSSTELRQKYGVTLQSTFVSVDSQGNEVSTWVGYGKDKSVEAIVSNL
jgi:thiol-disulfide isomerase/thioredoxin